MIIRVQMTFPSNEQRAGLGEWQAKTSCARGDTICPCLSPPCGRPSASRAAEQTQRSSTFSYWIRSPRWPLQPPYALRPRWVKRPGDLDLDLLTLKVVSDSRVTWATSAPILVFLDLSVLDSIYARCTRQTDRQTDVIQKASLNAPPIRGGGHEL